MIYVRGQRKLPTELNSWHGFEGDTGQRSTRHGVQHGEEDSDDGGDGPALYGGEG